MHTTDVSNKSLFCFWLVYDPLQSFIHSFQIISRLEFNFFFQCSFNGKNAIVMRQMFEFILNWEDTLTVAFMNTLHIRIHYSLFSHFLIVKNHTIANAFSSSFWQHIRIQSHSNKYICTLYYRVFESKITVTSCILLLELLSCVQSMCRKSKLIRCVSKFSFFQQKKK